MGKLAGARELRSRYVVTGFDATPHSSGITEAAVTIHGALYTYEWSKSALLRDLELDTATFGPPEKAWGNAPNGRRGFGHAELERGTITVVPWTLGRVYRELGITVARDYLIDRVLTATGWQPDLEWDLPDQVMVFAGRSDEGLVLHLNNLSGARQTSVGAHVSVSGGEIILDCGITSARALVAGIDLPVANRSGRSHISLPTIEGFEVVVIPEG